MHPVFGPVATVVAGVLFGYALLVEPWWGRRVHRRLVRGRDADPRVLLRTFRLTIAAQLVWAVLVLVAVVTATDLPARDLGLRMPAADPLALVLAGVLAVSVLASILVRQASARRAAAGDGAPPAVPDAIAAMLPRTTAERWYAAAVAVTAGGCEELLFRGFFVAAGTGPGEPPPAGGRPHPHRPAGTPGDVADGHGGEGALTGAAAASARMAGCVRRSPLGDSWG
jgi:uncharacterized protein